MKMKGETMNRKCVIRTLAVTMGAAMTLVASSQAWAAPAVSITEWMYNGDEFIEFTNITAFAIDFTGWSFDDDSRTPGTVSLSGFGWVDAGESVLLTESFADAFRTAWNLDVSVKILGSNGTNLGRNDEINLFNDSGILVDQLTFGDQNIPGTIRTLNVSGNPLTFAALGAKDVSQWVLASTGDVYGSYASVIGDIGNPGLNPFPASPVPVPAAAWLLGSGLIGLAGVRRRKA
jgi:predicted extracellular nuclease